MRFTISNSLFLVRNKRYIPEYLSIVTGSEYGEQYDMIIDILCRFRVEAALPVLISLYEQNPKEWTFAFLTLGKLFRNPIIVPYLRGLQNHPDGEFRSMAKKALRFLGCLQEAAESAPNETSPS